MNYFIVFFISLFSICLELFLTRILNLKTFNHIVYVIIPFSLLGFGIGANLFFLSESRIRKWRESFVVAGILAYLAAATLGCVLSIIHLPVSIESLRSLLLGMKGGWILVLAYVAVMIPFIGIGFLLLYIFSRNSSKSHILYFFDLLGAGCGAIAFFLLINSLQVFQSVVFLSLSALFLALGILYPERRRSMACFFILCTVLIPRVIPEIQDYHTRKGNWENFANVFKKDQFYTIFTKWHPLGRTDVYRLKTFKDQKALYDSNRWTFQINVSPFPDFSYFSTDFLSGTPVFNLSSQGLEKRGSKLKLFSMGQEVPYILFRNPKVVVVGAGGGRDIFIAKSHGAPEVVGAEINPAIHSALSPGGMLYDYSGRIYTQQGVRIGNIDARHLVKNLPSNHYDLVVINGVDTFSGLSSGAYTYSESYLYTKEAIMDYLRVLNDQGVIIFYRWCFDPPRETLRLFVIALDALQSFGQEKPWDNVIVAFNPLGMTMIKKAPYTNEERAKIDNYLLQHDSIRIFPSQALTTGDKKNWNFFDKYSLAFRSGLKDNFIKKYMFDISTVTDNNPFFYKYYRVKYFTLSRAFEFTARGAGFIIFLTQLLVLFQAVIFILIFIFLPLRKLHKDSLRSVPGNSLCAFVSYFACLGTGFMFIEIPLMQQFVLLLGSPIYSISVTLASLLIFTGVGSSLLKLLQGRMGGAQNLIKATLATLVVWLTILIIFKNDIINIFIPYPFVVRIFVVSMMLLPAGICLGIFFPSGLQLIKKEACGLMPWAWGINLGFSVLGSMLAIIIAQISGFSFVLLAALFIYFLAACLFLHLSRHAVAEAKIV